MFHDLVSPCIGAFFMNSVECIVGITLRESGRLPRFLLTESFITLLALHMRVAYYPVETRPFRRHCRLMGFLCSDGIISCCNYYKRR